MARLQSILGCLASVDFFKQSGVHKTRLMGCAHGRGESRRPEHRTSKRENERYEKIAVETVDLNVNEWGKINRGER